MTKDREFKIKDKFARNMFSIPNMDFFMGEVTSEGVNSNVWKVQVWVLSGQKYVHCIKYAIRYGWRIIRND